MLFSKLKTFISVTVIPTNAANFSFLLTILNLPTFFFLEKTFYLHENSGDVNILQ